MGAGIAQVTKYYAPHRGGMESHIQGISEELVKQGLRVRVYTSNVPPGREFMVHVKQRPLHARDTVQVAQRRL